jgi:hypothetical protein
MAEDESLEVRWTIVARGGLQYGTIKVHLFFSKNKKDVFSFKTSRKIVFQKITPKKLAKLKLSARVLEISPPAKSRANHI